MTRTALLGGEVRRRGMLGARRSRLENTGLAAGVLLGALCLLGGGLGWVLAGVLLIGGAWLLCTPIGLRSPAVILVRELRWWRRRRSGATAFVPASWPGTAELDGDPDPDRPAPAMARPRPAAPSRAAGAGRRRGGSRRRTQADRTAAARRRPPRPRLVPDAVGRVRVLSWAPPGSAPLAIVHHQNPGEPDYLSAAVEVDGVAGGLREEADYNTSAVRFGRLLAALGRDSSLVSGLQLLNRVVPLDTAEHERFIAAASPTGGLQVLADSYQQLIAATARSSEQHRNFLIVRIPMSRRFWESVREHGGGDAAWGRVVWDELVWVTRLARHAGLTRPRGCGERRLAGLLRSLQDPDHLVDDHDVDLTSCWQPAVAQRDHVLVNDKWATRVARVAADALPPDHVHTRWLAPLLTGVSPSVIRTVSVAIETVPARVARPQARSDVTMDRSAAGQASQDRQVSDGSVEVQSTASAQRLADLRPGSGHHGARFAVHVAVTAPPGTLRTACERVEEAARECGLSRLDWLDTEHDVAAVACWPLWRGMRA